MKIIQFCFNLSSGGAEKFVVNLSNELAELGHDVEVCILRPADTEDGAFNKQFLSDKVKFTSLGIERGFSLAKVYKVSKYIKAQKPNVVHCHLNVIPYIFPLALMCRGIRFVHTLHSIASEACGGKRQVGINKFFYKNNLIQPVTISKLCQDSYIDLYHLNNAPYIDNGTAPTTQTVQFELVKSEVESMKQTSNTRVFIHVARFDEAKNQNLLIDVFNELNKRGVDFLLLVLGARFDTPEAHPLVTKACDRIKFLGVKPNVADYLYCAKAFCLSSNFEGLPISLIEALSAGLIPICTPVGGIPDVIEDGIIGYLSDDVSLDAYVVALERYLKDALSPERNIDYFNVNFTMTQCAKKYLDVYGK